MFNQNSLIQKKFLNSIMKNGKKFKIEKLFQSFYFNLNSTIFYMYWYFIKNDVYYKDERNYKSEFTFDNLKGIYFNNYIINQNLMSFNNFKIHNSSLIKMIISSDHQIIFRDIGNYFYSNIWKDLLFYILPTLISTHKKKKIDKIKLRRISAFNIEASNFSSIYEKILIKNLGYSKLNKEVQHSFIDEILLKNKNFNENMSSYLQLLSNSVKKKNYLYYNTLMQYYHESNSEAISTKEENFKKIRMIFFSSDSKKKISNFNYAEIDRFSINLKKNIFHLFCKNKFSSDFFKIYNNEKSKIEETKIVKKRGNNKFLNKFNKLSKRTNSESSYSNNFKTWFNDIDKVSYFYFKFSRIPTNFFISHFLIFQIVYSLTPVLGVRMTAVQSAKSSLKKKGKKRRPYGIPIILTPVTKIIYSIGFFKNSLKLSVKKSKLLKYHSFNSVFKEELLNFLFNKNTIAMNFKKELYKKLLEFRSNFHFRWLTHGSSKFKLNTFSKTIRSYNDYIH